MKMLDNESLLAIDPVQQNMWGEVNRLRIDNSTLENRNSRLVQEVSVLHAQLKQACRNNKVLSDSVAHLSATKSSLLAEIEALKSQAEDLSANLQTAQTVRLVPVAARFEPINDSAEISMEIFKKGLKKDLGGRISWTMTQRFQVMIFVQRYGKDEVQQRLGLTRDIMRDTLGIARAELCKPIDRPDQLRPDQVKAIVSKTRKLQQDGLTVKEIAQALGLSWSTLYYYLKKDKQQ
jgi:hypothetical protein